MTKKILVGRISSAFGIKGEVKIISYCEDPTAIEKYQLFDAKGNRFELKISNKNKAIVGHAGAGDPILIAKISGVDDRTKAENMRGLELFANRKDFDDLSDNEFYYADLIGLSVLNMESKKIGRVSNIFDFGAGSMLEIEFERAGIIPGFEKFENFPFKNEFFPEVNLGLGFVRFDAPEVVGVKQSSEI